MAPRKTTSTTKAAPRKKTSTARKEAPSSATTKSQKPVFSAGTWITVLLLAALIGFTFYLNRQKEAAANATPTNGANASVFAAAEGTPSSIEIKPADGESVRIEHDEKNVWKVKLPIETEANQGLAEAAATQISALKILDSIDGKLDIFGLDKPAYTITIEFGSGKKHTLEVGDSTPTNKGYYVRIDKDKMMITDLSGIDSLLNLVNSPPYLNTLTPTSTITSTPLPPTLTPVPPTEAVTVTPTP